MNSAIPEGEAQSALDSKVLAWLEAEGYPLEFAVANAFRKHGLTTRQGEYVRSAESTSMREIDVVAHSTLRRTESGPFVRFVFLTECKWSKDKPWVVLTSPHTQMHPAACASQMITSKLAESALWTIAGDPELHTKTTLFQSNQKNGFNGRQVFAKNQDAFYTSIQSIVEKAYCYVNEHRDATPHGQCPRFGIIAFPLIVVDGVLFESSFNENTGKVELGRRDWIRCFWNGSTSWPYFATVDVIAFEHLEAYVERRKSEIDYVLGRLLNTCEQIARCYSKKSLDGLDITSGSRGIIGLPSLLTEIREAEKTPKTSGPPKQRFAVPAPDASRFTPAGEPIGIPADFLADQVQVYLLDAPSVWLRLSPVFSSNKNWLESDLKNAILTGGSKFIADFSPSTFRSSAGFGLYAKMRANPSETQAAVLATKTGEIWSVDTYLVDAYAREGNRLPNLEPYMADALAGMHEFLKKIGQEGPFQWIAGIEGILGKRLSDDSGSLGPFRGSVGVAIADKVISKGTYSDDEGAQASLATFFTQLWDVCGAKRIRPE